MKIILKSIHSNTISEKQRYAKEDVQVRLEVGYCNNPKGNLNLNYHIHVDEGNEHLMVTKCMFEIMAYDHNIDEKTILDQAVDMLQERVEVILGLLLEEMGFDLQG